MPLQSKMLSKYKVEIHSKQYSYTLSNWTEQAVNSFFVKQARKPNGFDVWGDDKISWNCMWFVMRFEETFCDILEHIFGGINKFWEIGQSST